MSIEHFITNLTDKSYHASKRKPAHELVFKKDDFRYFLHNTHTQKADPYLLELFDKAVEGEVVDIETILRLDKMIEDRDSYEERISDLMYDKDRLTETELDMIALFFRMPKNYPDHITMGVSLLQQDICNVFVRESPDIHACIYDIAFNDAFGNNEEEIQIAKDVLMNIMRAFGE